MDDAQSRFAAANLADIKNPMSAPARVILRVLCGHRRLNTEVTESLCVLWVEAFEARSTQRSPF